MGAQAKIRLLLALLCASLLFTSIVVEQTYTPANNLEQTARKLSQNLHDKESFVTKVAYNEQKFDELRGLDKNPAAALRFIQDFTTNKNIWFITLDEGNTVFWSGVKIIPEDPGSIKDGFSFIRQPNGYYEAIRKSEGSFSVIFFIPVKLDYAFQNQFLRNTFATDLLKDNSIEMADFTDKDVAEIRSINDTYLFSVKLKPGEVNPSFVYYELAVWVAALLSLCILATNICNYICRKGYTLVSFLTLGSFAVLIRFINIYFHWPDFTSKLQLFMPELYHGGVLNPSLGDFCLNVLLLSWFVAFIYTHRKKIIKRPTGMVAGYLVFTVSILLLVLISTALQNLFYGLVVNSRISFDLSNILNLSYFSIVGVLMLCFSFLVFFLLSEVFLTISVKLPVPNTQKAVIFISIIVLATIVYAWHHSFTLFYLLWGALVFTRSYAYRRSAGALDAASLAIIILVCSFMSAIRLNYYEAVKENLSRKLFIKKLEVPDDPTADDIFKRIEKQLTADTSINNHFNDSSQTGNFIKSRLREVIFLNGYLSRYEFMTPMYLEVKEQPLSNDKGYDLGVFKDMVLYSSYNMVSRYFYRENQSFGFLKYFAILPVVQNDEKN